MRPSRIIVCALAAAVLCGCTSIRSSSACDKGNRIKNSEFSLWPFFEAERTIYANGVQNEGNVLCFIQWSTWHGARTPKAKCGACSSYPASGPAAAAPAS